MDIMCIGICGNCIYVVSWMERFVRTVVMPYTLKRILCVLVLLGKSNTQKIIMYNFFIFYLYIYIGGPQIARRVWRDYGKANFSIY